MQNYQFFIYDSDKNRFTIRVLYSDKYSKDYVKHFVDSYKLILQDMTHKDKLSDINYTLNEDISLLDKYNQTEHEFEYDDILDAFNDNLIKYEDNILVGYKDKAYTFGESAFIINEVAEGLKGLGTSKQDFVALFVPRSEWFLLASMGVLSLGAVYVPIDTSYPDERILLMLEDSGCEVVIAVDESKQRMNEIITENNLDISILNVSDYINKNIGSLNHLDHADVDENDIAILLYTSGTTGTPKGSLTTRKALNNFVSWYVNETEFTSKDIYGMHCSYVFDMHTHAVYSPVITGGSLYVVPDDIRLDLKALNGYYVEHGCTHTYITSQVGKLFAESGMDTTIKLLCFGGMKLGELNAPDSIGPFETYGPSENLAVSTSIFANKRIHHSSIGHFISNVKGYVLDKEHRRVPIGAVGELHLAGHQLTPGYLNRKEENSKAFHANPFDDDENYSRIYSTGDMVRFLSDGTLSIVGRRDNQVKIRGNRVELTEVESVIRTIDFIEDVTVQTVQNNGNNELVAYVVISNDLDNNNLENNLENLDNLDNNDLNDNELLDYVRKYVSERKPDYMIPSFVIKMNSIPLNVNGKVDKRALPKVDIDSLHAEYVAPRTENEKAIVKAFENVFNQENIGIYDDFVRLGGDSLTAIKLLPYLEDYNIAAADILSLRTPQSIANHIVENLFDSDVYSLDEGCPLNESQLNVYLDIVANNKFDTYILPLHMRISKEYDIDAIKNALEEILIIHPILGMCVSDEFEVPYLVKGSKPPIVIESDAMMII